MVTKIWRRRSLTFKKMERATSIRSLRTRLSQRVTTLWVAQMLQIWNMLSWISQRRSKVRKKILETNQVLQLIMRMGHKHSQSIASLKKSMTSSTLMMERMQKTVKPGAESAPSLACYQMVWVISASKCLMKVTPMKMLKGKSDMRRHCQRVTWKIHSK